MFRHSKPCLGNSLRIKYCAEELMSVNNSPMKKNDSGDIDKLAEEEAASLIPSQTLTLTAVQRPASRGDLLSLLLCISATQRT